MNPYYKDYSEYLSERFPGLKVQKLSVDAGFSCPNRDGTISRGGCIYCDNRSFTPRYCDAAESVAEQLRKGKAFFARKYPQMKYLAYFQSFTGTHTSATGHLRSLYEEAASQKDVVGIIIGTRPDCLPGEVLDMLEEMNGRIPVIVELGAETSHDETLEVINRHHTWFDVCEAVQALDARGIECGLHLIAGLPGRERGEGQEEVLETVRRALRLPVKSLKLHQMQVISGTPMHRMLQEGILHLHSFTLEEYLELCEKIISVIGRDVCMERFLASAPPEMVVSPKWGLKNYEFTNLLLRRLALKGAQQR